MKSAAYRLFYFAIASFCFAAGAAAPVAQEYYNPDPKPCGMPDRGPIAVTVTYNLTADCDMRYALYTHVEPTVTLTINGNGHTIRPRSTSYRHNRGIWITNASSKLVLKNVTIDGSLDFFQGMIYSEGTLDLDNVTIRSVRAIYSTAIISKGDATLDNTLFEDLTNFDLPLTTSGVTAMTSDGSATLTNTVVRGSYGGAGVFRAGTGGTLTLNGCATFTGIIATGKLHSVTDNTGGTKCSGTIGNGDKAVDPPAELDCGLPGNGVLEGNKTYNMTANCVIGAGASSVSWYIDKDANITINGSGHRIETGGWITSAPGSTLTLNNVVAKKTTFLSFGALNVQNSILDASSTTAYGSVSFSNSSAVNHPQHAIQGQSNGVGAPSVTIRNAVFRSNIATNTFPVLQMYAGAMTLEGCITAEDNGRELYNTSNARITDNSTGSCSPDETIGPTGFTIARLRVYTAPPPQPVTPEPEVTVGPPLPNCYQPLGVLGIICRDHDNPDKGIEVWESGEQGRGNLLLSVTPEQVNAAANESLIVSSLDGRAAAYVTGPRCIVRENKPRVHSPDCIAGQLTSLRKRGKASASTAGNSSSSPWASRTKAKCTAPSSTTTSAGISSARWTLSPGCRASPRHAAKPRSPRHPPGSPPASRSRPWSSLSRPAPMVRSCM